MCLSDLRNEYTGVLTAVSEDVHAVNVSGPVRAEERRQRAHLIRMSPAPGGDQLELVFCRFRLIVDELLVHGREQPVIEIRLIPCFKRLRPLVCLRHGVGSDGGEIDHHAAIGQHRIECLDHIDRADRVDFNDVSVAVSLGETPEV